MLFFLIVIILLYVFQILQYRIGWDKIKFVNSQKYMPKVSVLVAMRNEESEIIRLITDLKKQIYPTDKLEFLLINDHSTDSTLELVEQFAIDNLRIINMPKGEFGKKNAIKKAVSLAKGEIILATDADCSFSPNWVKTMGSCFSDSGIKLVSGPVRLHRNKGVFQHFQFLEFTSLIGSGAGAIGLGQAIFCNGANMAYRKEIFLQENNFERDTTASGDDVFLLHSVKAKYPKSIAFAKNEEAIVTTNSEESIKGFINQRKRWTAKSSNYKDLISIYVAYLVLLVNLSIGFLFIIQFFHHQYFKLFIFLYSVKFIADFFLLYPVLKFFKRTDLMKWTFLFELLYSFYIVLIVVLSFTQSFEWKERAYKK